MNTTISTAILTKESFRFRDGDLLLKDEVGRPKIRRLGNITDAEERAIKAGQISKEALPCFMVSEFGKPRPYFEQTVAIAGVQLAYRAAADGPDAMRADEFDALVDRVSGRLLARLYGKA